MEHKYTTVDAHLKSNSIQKKRFWTGEFGRQTKSNCQYLILFSMMFIGLNPFSSFTATAQVFTDSELISEKVSDTSLAEKAGVILEIQSSESPDMFTRHSGNSNRLSVSLTQDHIDQFGDLTIKNAMIRLPGVMSGRRGELNLRGVGRDRYSVTMDGRRMGTTGLGDRSFDLGSISSDMVSELEYIKVVTPDMDAEGLGGMINLRTRRPVGGERQLGIRLGGDADTGYFRYMGPGSRASLNYYDTIGDDFSFNIFVSHQLDNRGWENLGIEYDVANFGNGDTDVINRISPGLFYEERNRLGAGLQMTYQPTQQTTYHIHGMVNTDNRAVNTHHVFRDAGRDWLRPDTTGREGAMGRYGYDASLQNLELQLYMIQAGVVHHLQNFDLTINAGWGHNNVLNRQLMFPFLSEGLDYQIDMQDPVRPEMHITTLPRQLDGTIDYRNVRFLELERIRDDHTENNFSGNIDLDIPFSAGSIKIGSSAFLTSKNSNYLHSSLNYTRNLTLARFRMVRDGEINIFNRDNYIIPWVIDTDVGKLFFDDHRPLFSGDENLEHARSDIWNYDIIESIYAGYGMATVELGNITLLGGARLEYTDSKNEGRQIEFDEDGNLTASSLISRTNSYIHLFPNAQIAFNPGNTASVHLAYSRNIARPDFNIIAPFEMQHAQNSLVFRGNPELEPAVSDNLDAFFEFNLMQTGLFGIGIFYKKLSNFVYERTETISGGSLDGWQQRTYENGDESATIYGAEISWQQQLDFLPGFLGNFGTFANYTWSHSIYEIDFRDDEIWIPGHSPHVVNAALQYNQGRLSGQIAYHWTAESLVSLAQSPGLAPAAGGQIFLDHYEHGKSDLSLFMRIRISEHFRFWANVSNLLGADRVRYVHSPADYALDTDVKGGISLRAGIQYRL